MDQLESSNKQKIIDKWAPVFDKMGISGDRKDWMSEYAEAHEINETDKGFSIYGMNTATQSNTFPSLLPIAIRVAAQTISSGDPKLLEAAKSKVKAVNRERQIDSIIDESEDKIVPFKIEETEEYKEYLKSDLVSVVPLSAPRGQLFYLDYVYGGVKEIPSKKIFRRPGYYTKLKKAKH